MHSTEKKDVIDDFNSQLPDAEQKLRYEEVLLRLCLISRLGEAVSLVENLPELCIAILNSIIEFTAAENCSIMLSDPETGSLNILVGKGRDDVGTFFNGDGTSKTVFARGQGAAGWAAENAQVVCIDDCDADNRFISMKSATKEVSSVICAPIVFEDTVMGVLNCSHMKKERFNDTDKRNVALVAEQAGSLLHKALMIDKLKKEQRQLKRQLNERTERLSEAHETVTQLQEQLYKTERFATLGELLADVAHELNNRIAPMLIYAQMLREQGNDQDAEKRLRIIEESATGSKEILESLLNYSRPGPAEHTRVNLNQTLQNTLTLAEYKLQNKRIELSLELSPDLPPAIVNEKQIAQVFLNVINNAIDAIGEMGGRLEIKSACDRGKAKFVISDSGPGVSEEIALKIFDPFFTTKEKGTGLGLSISKSYLEEHHGSIYLDSNCSLGATFVIELPVTVAKNEVAHDRYPSPESSDNAARILVVDDDSAIRDVIRDVLGPGYDVQFAADGQDAARKIRDDAFDLIVVDYHMPGFDGKQLYEWITNNRPTLKRRIVFSTADIYHKEIRDFIEGTGCQCLSKPFSTIDLRKIVSEALKA